MRWKELSKTDANSIFLNWTNNDIQPSFTADDKYKTLYDELQIIMQKNLFYLESNMSGAKYNFDLNFGLDLYNLLYKNYNFTVREASNDKIWIFISMKVIPDIVLARWGLTESRFFKESRRIWLKTIWWYIHLSWQKDRQTTHDILDSFSTDEIVQLVERVGPFGYRIDLTRELMSQFSKKNLLDKNRDFFRQAMKLNTARLKLVEPSLFPGGPKKYVEELIKYFD